MRFCQQQVHTGPRHSVTGAAEGHERPSCSCTEGKLGNLCWHAVKVLMVRGASEAALLECLGTYFGTQFGGYSKLYQEMAAAKKAAEETLEVEAAQAGNEQLELEAGKEAVRTQTRMLEVQVYTVWLWRRC